MKKLERVQTPYNDVEVWRNRDGSIDFDVVGATHATWHPSRLMTGHAWDAITGAVLLHPEPPGSLLMLGLGGGTVLRQLRRFLPGVQLTAVEIDGDMIRLARTYMDLDALEVEIIEADAFAYLGETRRRFDIVVDDLYRCGEKDVERPEEVTRELIGTLRDRLAPGGSLVMNFVTGAGHHRQHRRARKAFLESFASVRAIRPPLSHNEALVGTTAPGGLRGPRALGKVKDVLDNETDRGFWKELRNLKLR